ncbi:MAG TPA: YhjD/YihY/BrkB family envelope integrity protein [Gaiellaceae bacterium]
MATRTAHRKQARRGKPLSRRVRDTYELWSRLFTEHELMTCASAISFKVIVSSVSLVLLGLGVLGKLGREDVWRDRIAPHIHDRVLPDVYKGINQTVEKIFSHDTTGLIVFASVLAIWQFSGAVRAAMNGLSHIYEEEDTRPWWLRFLVSVGLAIAIVVALLGAILLVVAAGGAVNGPYEIPFAVCRWLGAISLVGLAFGLLVRYGPKQRRAKRWASVGATLVVAAWLVEAIAFRWWFSTFANFKTATGSLTILLFVTAYFYIAAIILLVAIELDELLREDAGSAERAIHELF